MPFSLNHKYKTLIHEQLKPQDLQVLTNLYLPLIGTEALTLYLALANTLGNESEMHSHITLIDRVGLSGQRFLQAREKLEGFGLVKSYEQTLTLGSQWVYEIFLPVSKQNFLSDKLLVKLLKLFLGSDEFEILRAQMLPKHQPITGKNVSKGFFDVVNEDNFKTVDEVQLVEPVQAPLKEAITKSTPQLDLDLMAELLQSFGVDKTELLKQQSDLLILKQLYALDEIALVRVIQGNVSANHTIDLKQIEKQLAVDFQKQQTVENTTQPQTVTKSTGNPLVDKANQMGPLEFLADIREQTGGIVTASEQYAIEQLMRYDKLPKAVINMELYVLAVKEKRTNLSKALLEATYTDWAQAKLKTPADVIKYIQERDQKIKASGTRRGSYAKQLPPRETKPDWDNQPVTVVSEKEQANLDAMLANMAAKRKEKEGK